MIGEETDFVHAYDSDWNYLGVSTYVPFDEEFSARAGTRFPSQNKNIFFYDGYLYAYDYGQFDPIPLGLFLRFSTKSTALVGIDPEDSYIASGDLAGSTLNVHSEEPMTPSGINIYQTSYFDESTVNHESLPDKGLFVSNYHDPGMGLLTIPLGSASSYYMLEADYFSFCLNKTIY